MILSSLFINIIQIPKNFVYTFFVVVVFVRNTYIFLCFPLVCDVVTKLFCILQPMFIEETVMFSSYYKVNVMLQSI